MEKKRLQLKKQTIIKLIAAKVEGGVNNGKAGLTTTFTETVISN